METIIKGNPMTPTLHQSPELKASEKGTIRNLVTAEEWQTRVELAACYRLAAMNGWDDLVFTHMSARVPRVWPSPVRRTACFLYNRAR